jgi:hypothetical protein
MSDSEKEDFGKWVICGVGGEVFVGKPVAKMSTTDPRFEEPLEFAVLKSCRLSPCYRYSTTNISVPQTDASGRVVGVNVQMVEQVTSPSNAPCDVAIDVVPAWSSPYPLTPGLIEHESLKAHIQRLVKIARDAQLAMRSAAAGIQLAGGRLRT